MCKNKIYFSIACFFVLITSNVQGQDFKSLYDALKTGKYEMIQSNLDSQVDLCILDDQKFENQAKAISRIKTFFNQNPITTIEPLHTGNSKKNNATYKLAKIISKGKPYRLFLFYESVNKKHTITEIRIENYED